MKKKKDILISIVIISHNQEDIIGRSVESAINQSYRNIEIICVDDGSTDHTISVLREYEKNDLRVNVISKEKCTGLNNARREGVETSTGDYLLFIDGDDYLETCACEVLKNEIIVNTTDILHFGSNIVSSNCVSYCEEQNTIEILRPVQGYLYGTDILRKCFFEREYSYNMWAKLYAVSLLKNAYAHMDRISLFYSEDMYQYFVISNMANSYHGITDRLYNYSYGEGTSFPKSKSQLEWICSGKNAINAIEKYVSNIATKELNHILDKLKQVSMYDLIQKSTCLQDVSAGEGIDVLLNHFDPATIVVGMLRYCDNDSKRIVSYVKDSKNLEQKRNDYKIRTIGTFFQKISLGGTERVLCNLARIWNEMGYRVVIFTDESPSEEDYEIPSGVERVVLPSFSYVDANTYHIRAKELQKKLLEHDVDVMVYHAWISRFLLIDQLVCKLNHIGFVIHCHNVFSQMVIVDPAWFSGMAYSFSLADGIVTLSSIDSEFWRSFNDTIFTTVNPTKYHYVSEIPRSLQNGKRIIWCQRFSPEKNPEDMIEVFQMVHQAVSDAHLMVLGKGLYREDADRLQFLVKEKHLSEAVTFYGYQKDVEKFYCQADLCLITSDYEGYPMGMIESMGAGVPVVMYDLPYLTLVEKGKGIITVPGQDKRKMADEVIRLLQNEEERKRLGKEARESIEEMLQFDYQGEWRKFFERLERGGHRIKEIPLMWDTLFTHYRMGFERMANEDAWYHLNEIRKSKSYRWGHALTFIPRWIRHKLTGFPM